MRRGGLGRGRGGGGGVIDPPLVSSTIDLATAYAVGVGLTQYQLSAMADYPLQLREWYRDCGIRYVRFNIPWVDHAVEVAQIRACVDAGLAVVMSGLDHGPVGIEDYLNPGEFAGLQTWASGLGYEAAAAYQVAGFIVKARGNASGIEFLRQLVIDFRTRNQAVLGNIWFSFGNDVENLDEYMFLQNYYGDPPITLDSSDYAGRYQVTDRGQTGGLTVRTALETALGTSLPSDVDIRTNTAAADAILVATVGAGRHIGNGAHAYYELSGDTIVYGESGLNPPSPVLMEYGIAEDAFATSQTAETFAGTVVGLDDGDYAFSNHSNATTSNNQYMTGIGFDTNLSENVVFTNFGFAIPVGATITGIVVNIERSSPTNVGHDNLVALTKDGASTVSNDKADLVTAYPTSDTVKSYGTGTTDLWGTTWTPAEINASTFGLFFRTTGESGSGSNIRVDAISIIIYYTVPGAVGRYDLLARTPATARLVTYWPDDTDDLNILNKPAYRAVVIAQARLFGVPIG